MDSGFSLTYPWHNLALLAHHFIHTWLPTLVCYGPKLPSVLVLRFSTSVWNTFETCWWEWWYQNTKENTFGYQIISQCLTQLVIHVSRELHFVFRLPISCLFMAQSAKYLYVMFGLEFGKRAEFGVVCITHATHWFVALESQCGLIIESMFFFSSYLSHFVCPCVPISAAVCNCWFLALGTLLLDSIFVFLTGLIIIMCTW